MATMAMGTSRRGSRASLLVAICFAAFASPFLVDAKVVPRPSTAAAVPAAEKETAPRVVDLPRNELSKKHQHAVDENNSGNEGGSGPVVADTAEAGDDILPSTDRHVEVAGQHPKTSIDLDTFLSSNSYSPSPPRQNNNDGDDGSSKHQQQQQQQPNSASNPLPERTLLLDATYDPSTSDIDTIHSSDHDIMLTSYNGDVASSSIEFTLQNHDNNGKYVILSGMGLNIKIVSAEDEQEEAPAPCRIKMYTARTTNGTAIDVSYQLALDAKVTCQGSGQETLLPSDLFVRNYRMREQQKKQQEDADIAAAVTNADGGERKLVSKGGREIYNYTHVENMDHGTVTGATQNSTSSYSNSTHHHSILEPFYGLTSEERNYPLLIPPNEILSVNIVALPVDNDEATDEEASSSNTTFLILSSDGGIPNATAPSSTEQTDDETNSEGGELYLTDSYLNLYTGSSIIHGYVLDDPAKPPSLGGAGHVDTENILETKSPTIFNGALYYDSFNGDDISLREYFDELQYSLLPGDPPGCTDSFDTGYIDTVGSYGVMFDVTSVVTITDADKQDENFVSRFKDIEIYGMDLYIRNLVNTTFQIHVRKHSSDPKKKYMSYLESTGQTMIKENWELIARGNIEGKGPNVGSPVPASSWRRNVVIEPGETVGFYVTVHGAPDLRYRNSTLTEGSVYKSNDHLAVTVGRSWGEYPLRGDGTDVYFAPREFSGGFQYHVHEGLCESNMPSIAPSYSSDTHYPSASLVPTLDVGANTYLGDPRAEGMCPEDEMLETTFQDGTGSYGALFDVLAKSDLTLTGIDLNMDWNTGHSADILIYARQGSWFGHQNNAESWPHLLVNTTLSRPDDFHNRSIDGPYIPIDTKRNSAIVPRGKFKPLTMKIGETWSLYICTSLADFRYTLGTSIGKTFASNNQLRIMEGAGAADYPPFMSGMPEAGGVEYTFYAPRVFNGNLRYDYIADCPSEAPSSVYTTPAPTPIPSLTTSVSYTFYVEHSPDKLKGAITYDMSFGVRAVLDRFLGGEEDVLFGLAKNHELVIDQVVANLVSPTEIGYLCYPTPPETCTPISVDVTATHRNTATTDEVTFALLRQSMDLPLLIDVEGYTIEYVGDRAVETNSEITISGVPDREMGEVEQTFFEEVARDFLRNQVTDDSSNDSLKILSVTINGQEITSDDSYEVENDIPSSSARNNPQRRLEKSNKLSVSVKGKYRPPPELNFGELVEKSINRDRELLQKELNKPPALKEKDEGELSESTPTNYFTKAKVEDAREIKEQPQKNPEALATVLSKELDSEDSLKEMLHLAAMGVGGLIFLLSALFVLRPHRRRAMFGSKSSTRGAYGTTQPVDVEDQTLLKKSRAMIRGEELPDSFTTGGAPLDKGYDPRASAKSERMLAYSDFSSGQPPTGFDPRASGNSLQHSFTRGTTMNAINSSQTSGGAPYAPVSNRAPPRQQPNFHNSMPPMRGGPRGGPSHRINQETVPPRTRRDNPIQMSMPPRHFTGWEGGPRQMDPRRNLSMRPEHHPPSY